ncbi:MAG: thiopeptide-type bacteriocin biosynthesis protein [Actinomycetota bacterium]|nr:thiopeptide-type bacteriocin biosynthesis protein [Actinomycetota bacterium]
MSETEYVLDQASIPQTDAFVPSPTGAVPIEQFLERCLRGVAGIETLERQHRTFLAAGLSAVKRSLTAPAWAQLGLAVEPARLPAVYDELALLADELLVSGEATNFFFMHKAPGLRVRFEAPDADPTLLRRTILERAQSWQRGGLIRAVEHGVYEPEEQLFGGPTSMECVHALFTVDSLGWLDHHRAAVAGWPAWMFSLYSIRAILDGLGIVGWEDLGVWSRVRGRGARRLSEEVTGTPQFTDAAAGIQQAWAATAGAEPPAVEHAEQPVALMRTAMLSAAQRWRTDYFQTSQADIGPRDGAAMAVIFHWNRAGLSPLRQGLITEALLGQSQS